jgi:hypothetical protein
MGWGEKLGKTIIEGYRASTDKKEESHKESFWSTKNLLGNSFDMWNKMRKD